MVTGWVSEAWPLVGFLRHGHWVGFRGMAAGCKILNVIILLG